MNIITPGGAAYTIDRSSSRRTTPRVTKFTFGDGYTQRLAQGLNIFDESFSVSFNNRPKAEIDTLVAYLESLSGSIAFGFSPPDYPEVISTVTYSNSAKTIVRTSGTDFSTIIPYNYILVKSSTNNGSFKLNKASTNTTTTMTVHDATLTNSSGTSSTIRGAVSVVCEEWNLVYINAATLSLNATLVRDYTP